MRSIFIVILFVMISNIAKSQQSYMIPDIGSPGMSIYYEIIGVHDLKDVYGTDGFLNNEEGDPLRVLPLNLIDTNKVTFGPIVVSWNGRMISGQIFVKPNLPTDSWDWSALSNEWKIPIQIVKNGISLANENHTFYIVQPFPFGDRTGDAERVLGQGNLGKRSPRGAMIVDEMILAGDTYTVSKNDCDPNTDGNQGYLPFILLTKGDIKGTSNSKISVSASGRNGGPGGGGGGGRFADLDNGTNGGDGFSGGGNGGRNTLGSGSYELPGIGTGSVYKINSNGQNIAGYSLNGVPGAICNVGAYESSAGGTGHPFGKSGIASWAACDECEGEYGGGSGNKDRGIGGSGGFSTSAQNESGTSANNGGKAHGNRYGIPISGGSGGGGGNPQGSFPLFVAKSGYGGGGGGAIRVFATNINDVTFEADGNSGESGSPNGGAGSGGYVEVGVKSNVNNVSVSAARGNSRAGYGRFRFDSRNDFPSIIPPNNDQSQSISTIATEDFDYVERQFSLFVKKNSNEVMDYYIKPENGEWFRAFSFVDIPQTTKQFNIDLSAYTDTIFYGMAVQSTEYTGSEEEYKQVPKRLLSQAAGNIFRIAAIDLYCDQPRDMYLSTCNESVVYDTVWVENRGNIYRAELFVEDHTWDNGNNGFTLLFPSVDVPIEEKDSMRFIVRYTHTPGQVGIISNTLSIPYGKNLGSVDDIYKIEYNVDISNLKVNWYRSDGTLINDTLKVDLCLNDSFAESLSLRNESNIDFTIKNVTYKSTNSDYTLSYLNEVVEVGNSSNIQVGYNQASAATGTFTNTIYFEVDECDNLVDSLVIVFNVKEALLELSDGNSFVDFGNVNIVSSSQKTITVINKGNAPAYIENEPTLLPPYELVSSNKIFPLILLPGEEVEFVVKFSPQSEGTQIDNLILNLTDKFDGCNQTSTFELRGNGVESNLEFPYEIDWKSVQSCHSRPDSTIIIKNNSTFDVKINGSHTITGVNPENWEITNNIPSNGNLIAKNGGELSFDIRYKADIGVDGPKTAILKIPTDDISLPTESDPSKHLIIIQLKAYKEGLEISVLPNPLIDFGNSPINEESIKIALNVTNNSTGLTRTLNQIKPGEFRMYNGVNQTFAPGETKQIEVTVKLSEVGNYESDFELVFDTFGSNNCPATYTMQAKAFGIKGETKINPSNIDFGILNICETNESSSFTIENIGEVPIVLNDITLEGTDATYYTLSPFTSNDDINVAEIVNYDLSFTNIDDSYGTFTANVAVNITENGKDTTYKIPVTTIVSKGVKSNPIILDFGQVVSTLSYNLDIDLENQHNWSIVLEDMLQVQSFPTFSFDEASLDGKTIVGLETVNIMFTPPAVGVYEDSIKVAYLINGNCQDTITVILKGEGMPASELTLFIPDQVIDPTLAYVELPIMAQITNGLTSVPKFNIQDFTLTMDRTTFHPKNLSKGRINSITYPNQNEFSISISIDDVEVGTELKQISSLYAVPLLGNTEFSSITLSDMVVDKSGIFSNFIYQTANVELIICKADGDRLLKNNDIIELKVANLNSLLVMNGSIIESGYNQLDIISIDGKSIFSHNWIREIGGDKEFNFEYDVNELSTGLYIIRLTTPNDVLTQKIIINK